MNGHPDPCPGPDAHITHRGQPSCTAHVKATNPERAARRGMPCRRDPAIGSDVCVLHGAGAPAVRAASARRQQEAAAMRAVATLGLSRQIDPAEALLEEVWRTAGHVEWLGQRVQELQEDDMTWGTRRVKTGGDDAGTTEEAGPPVWYELYARERAHLVKVCAEAIRAGVEERKVRLAEAQGTAVAGVIRRSLDGVLDRLLTAGMPEALRAVWVAAVVEVVPRELRAIGDGAA